MLIFINYPQLVLAWLWFVHLIMIDYRNKSSLRKNKCEQYIGIDSHSTDLNGQNKWVTVNSTFIATMISYENSVQSRSLILISSSMASYLVE